MNKSIKQSLKEWCNENNRDDIINRWDYELNDATPNEIASYSKIKGYLKCPRGIHNSELYDFDYLCRNPKYKCGCRKCNSFAQYIIDNHDEHYLNYIWSDKNEKSPWDYTHGSNQKAFFNCLDNPEHIFEQVIFNRAKDCICPLCNNKNTHTKIAYENSLGVNNPESILVWSEKNNKTPYDYSNQSGLYVWWKCENGKHEDFERKICNSNKQHFKCPKCVRDNQIRLRGKDHPNWKGTTPEAVSARMNMDYKKWRSSVYERDGYLCQICLDKSHDRIQAHHILSFAKYPDLRYMVNNGITLCNQCHDNHYKGSFHQTYGTLYNTPSQLQEYATVRRTALGITTPFNIYDYMGDLQDPTKEQIDFTEEWSDDSAITDTSSQGVA